MTDNDGDSSRPAKRQKTENGEAVDGAVHGNYISYYNKRRPSGSPDPRLSHLDRAAWLDNQKILDVGCNSGRVTVEIAQTMNPRRVVGVDIDKRLVHKARQHLDRAFSTQSPVSFPVEHADTSARTGHFPIAFPFVHGALPLPPVDYLTAYIEQPEVETTGLTRQGVRKVMPERRYLFPRNVEFHHADWTTTSIQPDARGYDTVLALSVTKWIHLNGLNEGLLDFFEKCYRSILPGGRLVIEAQPFSSYAKAARRGDDKIKANWIKLRDGYSLTADDDDDDVGGSSVGTEDKGKLVKGLNPDTDFDGVLLEMGFDRVETLGKTGDKGFRRTIKVYHKRKGDWL